METHNNRPPRLVSIVVACRNEREHIGAFLERLRGQVLPPGVRWEALIADGRSTDGTRKILEAETQEKGAVRLMDNPGRIVSTGLNRAIRRARGEVIARMDVHTAYAPDYLAACLEALEETGADNVGGPAGTRAQGALQEAVAAAFHSAWLTGGARNHDVEYEGETDTVPYGCWRRETFERVGLFDEELVRSQDSEHNLRIRKHGGRVWQSPRIRSRYAPRASFSGLARQYFQYGYWKYKVIRKSGALPPIRHLVPPVFLLTLTLLGGLAGLRGWASRLFAALATAYACIIGWACWEAGRRAHRWRSRLLLPVVFVTVHVYWGAGFLASLLHDIGNPEQGRAQPPRLRPKVKRFRRRAAGAAAPAHSGQPGLHADS